MNMMCAMVARGFSYRSEKASSIREDYSFQSLTASL